MRVAFFRGDLCDGVIQIAPDQIDRYLAAYGCDHYLVAPLDDPGLRAIGEGAQIAGAASRLVAGSREIDRAKVATVTPAQAVPAAALAQLVEAREAAIDARAADLVEGKADEGAAK